MRLKLQSVIHTPGASLPFAFSMDVSEVELYGETLACEPLSVSGTVCNHADVLHLEGEATTELALYCDRCTMRFRRRKTIPLHYVLARELADEAESEILLLDGDELDLYELAYSAYVLDLDTKNLCSEDCKGLCAGCGVNLNEEACRCQPETDPRFAVLARLLDTTE